MTDRDTKKGKELVRPRVLASALHDHRDAVDAFEDEELDELLRRSLDDATEPRLVLLDRLLTGTRVRREV